MESYTKIQALIESGTIENIQLAFELSKRQNISLQSIMEPWEPLLTFFKHQKVKGLANAKDKEAALAIILNLERFKINLDDLTYFDQTMGQPLLIDMHISELSPSFWKLKNLKHLCLDELKIDALPNEVQNLSNLKDLELKYCRLNSLNPCVFELQYLEKLDVAFNEIKELSPEITKLQALKTLIIRGNNIRTLPETLLDMPDLKALHLKGNPIPQKVQDRFEGLMPNCKFY